MIVLHHRQVIDVAVKSVVLQNIAQCPRRFPTGENFLRSAPEFEVEDARQIRINVIPTRFAALKKRRLRRVFFKNFADHPKFRVLFENRPRPIADKGARHILNRVLPNAVNARRTDPPERVLNFVTRNFRLVLIQIGQ